MSKDASCPHHMYRFLKEPLDSLGSPKHNKPSFPKKAQLPQKTTHSLARKCCHFLAYTYFHANFISIDMIFKVHSKLKYYAFERGFITKFAFSQTSSIQCNFLGRHSYPSIHYRRIEIIVMVQSCHYDLSKF
jgi:hypothetical protein